MHFKQGIDMLFSLEPIVHTRRSSPPAAVVGLSKVMWPTEIITSKDWETDVSTEELNHVERTLYSDFRRVRHFWVDLAEDNANRFLPSPSLAIWIGTDHASKLRGFVRSYDRSDPEQLSNVPAHALKFDLDEGVRIVSATPAFAKPSAGAIAFVLSGRLWFTVCTADEFLKLFIRRYRERSTDAACRADPRVLEARATSSGHFSSDDSYVERGNYFIENLMLDEDGSIGEMIYALAADYNLITEEEMASWARTEDHAYRRMPWAHYPGMDDGTAIG
jgi:hypothetical protein